MKILILKPSSLGDVVQAVPVLRLLKRRYPTSQIYWWLQVDLLPLLADDPDLAGLYPFDRRRWVWPLYWKDMIQSIRQLRHEHFDWVIDLQSLARSAIFAWLARGSFTIGLDDRREGAHAFYDVAVPRAGDHTHAVDWYLKVLRHLGVPIQWDFDWLPPRPQVLAALRQKWQPQGNRWLVIHPGARWPSKRWPLEYYTRLAASLAHDFPDFHLAILGSGREDQFGSAVAQAAPSRSLDLTGQTTLPEMIEWIRLSELMVTNDTGPMHVAAALGKKVVALFGPTEPLRTGPYGQIDRILKVTLPCEPCLRAQCHYQKPLECLRAITPETVLAEIKKRLLEPSPDVMRGKAAIGPTG